ncbi:ATP-binding protein [Halocella sp. SP3-1]|uniref:sensor histidine kinase n=1 Tax=Halocella sp. SP3-1 TaxID=2382161 RepID=UPI000F765283|nr:ATP-binding protein [Halocella sp. SP3-1]AZO94216.1 sensor histidine kinase [Halocella sp. SP3-1]
MSKLGFKIFLIILLIALGGLLFTSLYLNISINRNFTNYLYQDRKEKIEQLIGLLKDSYQAEHNWLQGRLLTANFAKTNDLSLILEDRVGNILYHYDNHMMGPGMMQQHGMMNRRRTPIDDSRFPAEIFKIEINGNRVGTLYWYRDKEYSNLSDAASFFIKKINAGILIAGILVALITIVISLFFSRYLTIPLIKMNRIAQRVAEGDFNHHLIVKGNDELAELGNSINEMTDKLNYLERIRRESTADLAHELRTPLTTIKNYLEAVTAGVWRFNNETAAEIEEELDRLVRLVNRLGELSEAEKDVVKGKLKPIDLSEIFPELLEHFRPLAVNRGIDLVLKEAAENCFIKGNRDSIETIANNLLSNALKYTLPGGRVEVRLAKTDTQACLSVTDTGLGISAEDLPYIFERFYRTDRSRSSKTGGTGIGLTITKELVRGMDGEIKAVSEGENKGSTFTIVFPLRTK